MTDKTFTGVDLTTDHPPGICPACAVHGVRHIPSGTHYVYCEHSNTGVVRRPDENWVLFDNPGPQKFKRLILEMVMSVEIATDIVTDGATLQ
jgi:hypothetical protein